MEKITMNKIMIILSLVLVITSALAGCAGNATAVTAETGGQDTVQAERSDGSADSAMSGADSETTGVADNNDDDGDETDVTPIKTISEDGEYTLTGNIDGQVLVTAENVTLILDGATINCADASAILGKDGNGADVQQNLTVELRGKNTVISGAKHGIQGKDDLTVTGTGTVDISAEKDGLHAGDTLTVKDGAVNVVKSYEGMEATNIIISGGISTVNSTDDGVNATVDDGDDATPSVKITGGELVVYCTSDGVDSNGTLDVTGGTVAIFIGETRDGDGTDVDRSGTIQPTLYGEASITAGTEIAVGDLWSFTPASDVRTFCLMIPGIVNGQSYKITANGKDLTTATAVTTIQGMMGGGHQGGKGGGPGEGMRPDKFNTSAV